MALLISRLFQSIQAGLLCLLLSSVYTPHTVRAQTPDKFTLNPVTNFCQRWWSQSVVKNDILYIDSGLQKWNVTGVPSFFLGINSWMITIPLNVTWDWKVSDSMKIDAQAKGDNAKNPNTGTEPPSLIRGHMFHGPLDEPNVYVYGGTTYMGNMSFETFMWPKKQFYTWSYTYGAQYPWAQYPNDADQMPNHGAAAEAIDQGLGFYLNGQIDWGSTGETADIFLKTLDAYTPIEGMVVLDFETQSGKNISTSGLRDGVPRVAGTMEYLSSVGAMGVLVALGGQIQPSLTSTFANSSQGSLIDFGTVDVFDIDSYLQKPETSGTWYSQNTTGDLPPPRVDFCTVAISSADNSSHHIYLYGGYNPITNVAYDDMFVLTLPSFTWTNLWRRGESPRWGHKCHIAGKRQMISVGGNTPLNECDWELKGVAVWDLTALTWGSVFVADAPDFQVPRKLHNVTGGNESGNATVKDPVLGWTNQGLKTVFATRSKNAPSGNTSTGNSPSGSGSGSPTSKSKSNTGAIAGGVGGGVGAVVVIALVAFYYRRHQKRHGPHELADNSAPADQASYFPKSKFELHAINENSPAELYGHEIRELETPRQAVEADPHSSPRGAELSGTTTAPGALHGVPIVRTPGDDLPVQPEYVPGLRRPSRERRRSASVSSNNEQSDQPRPANTNTNGEETVIEQKIEEGESTAGKKSEKGEDAEEQKSESAENAVEPKSKDEKDNGEEKTECE